MYQEFSETTIDTIIAKKQLIVTFTKDIDTFAMKDTKIDVFERSGRTPINFSNIVDGNKLIITFDSWPIPNSEYILSIQNIKAVDGDELQTDIKKRIVFKSNIVSTVKIISPTNFEEVDELIVQLKEECDDESKLKNSFYIEIAEDNAFISHVVKTLVTDKTTLKISLPKQGNYFIRARVQVDNNSTEYGFFSDTISFLYGDKNKKDDNIDIDDPQEPVLDLEEFTVKTNIEQGVTPDVIKLEFSKDINELILNNIIITRKGVK